MVHCESIAIDLESLEVVNDMMPAKPKVGASIILYVGRLLRLRGVAAAGLQAAELRIGSRASG
jgi:hypothetical protein